MAPRLHSGSLLATEVAQLNSTVDRARIFTLVAPAAADLVSVHAAFAGNNASNAFPGPFASPAVPRNLQVDLGVGWDGGDVTVRGTRFGAAISEVFATGSGVTRVGSKVFDAVSSASKGAVGVDAATASIGAGNKLGASEPFVDSTSAVLFVDNVAEPATLDVATSAFTPVTVPNGVLNYALIANI